MGIQNGHLLYSKAVSAQLASVSSPAPVRGSPSSDAGTMQSPPPSTRKLTSRCAHGPRGACPHCVPVTDEDVEKKKNEPLNKAARFNPRHAERSSAPTELDGEMEWLCQHRPDAMCINCAPLKKGEKVKLEMLCLHGPGGRCINCLPPDTKVENRKYITYGEWVEQSRAKCEHSFKATCVNCAPPGTQSHTVKLDCKKHRPWPHGLCSDCAPPPVYMAAQPYRHVDSISFSPAATTAMQKVVHLWDLNYEAGIQRAAWFYGRVLPDDTHRFGQRVRVEAIYEPPQIFSPATASIRISEDPKIEVVETIAHLLGLQRVGLFFTKPDAPPGRSKGAKETDNLNAREIVAACELQNRYPRPDCPSGSQFITITMRKTGDKSYEPFGYMASDQMASLVREGIFANPAPGEKFLKVRVQQSPQDVPRPEVVISTQDRGYIRTTEVDPDYGIITLEVTGDIAEGSAHSPIFFGDYLPANRAAFQTPQTPQTFVSWLRQKKSLPWEKAVADFNFLIHMAEMIDNETAYSAAKALGEKSPFPEGAAVLLTALRDSM